MSSEMEETRDDEAQVESVHNSAKWSPSDLMEKLRSISLVSSEERVNGTESNNDHEPVSYEETVNGTESNNDHEPVSSEETVNGTESNNDHEPKALNSQKASQILWATGQFSELIPNGFCSIIAEKEFKELFDTIPSLDELYALDSEDLKAEVIIVDENKDKKLAMLKQLCVTLVKGLNSNPAALIKKIAGLVYDFYKSPNLEQRPEKAVLEEVSYRLNSQGVHLLGQIKHGFCHPRAILFKVLADTVGLESRLLVGLSSDGVIERTDSYKHMSVVVVLNSVELLVDLVRFPGQLIPFSTKAILMSHISAAVENDFMDNDSCDSPLEPNSPSFGFSDQVDIEGAGLRSPYQHKLEESIYVSIPSQQKIMLRSRTMVELNLPQSDPNIANAFWRRSRKKVTSENRTASSSPERPLSVMHRRSILGGHRDSFRDYGSEMLKSRSGSASPSGAHRRRRHSISMTPEIGDDVVRAVRAMNETVKRNLLPRDQYDARSCYLSGSGNNSSPHENVPDFPSEECVEISGERAETYNFHRKQINSQKAISLPTSPRRFRGQTFRMNSVAGFSATDDAISAWSRVLESSDILNKPLLPFHEWNIDFSELTVGTRVGIGFFGEVFRGSWKGTDVAIKVFLEQDLTIENLEDFCNEISILSRLRHPNVILFLGACTKPPRLSMVTEYMEMGSLYYLIHLSGQKKRLSWRKRIKMLCDICRGLMCIHRMKIVHRDLKSANCLVDKNWTVKICDFGLSRVMTTPPTGDSSSAGTPEWMAPELICNKPFTEKCDIFSLGVIIWELCTLKRPWEGIPSVQVVYAVANDGVRLEIPEGPLSKLISDCWAEPDERPTCGEVLSRLLACKNTLC